MEGIIAQEKMSHMPPRCFVLRLRLQKGGGGVFAGHYGISAISVDD